MGTIITFKCDCCGYCFDYFAGCGFCLPEQAMEIGAYGKKAKKVYSDLVAKYGMDKVRLLPVKGIYICGKCKKFKVHDGIKIYVDKKIAFDTTKVYCRCKHRMRRSKSDHPELRCPKCKSELYGFESGLWD